VVVAIVTDTEPVKLPPFGVIVGVVTVGWVIVKAALAVELGLYPSINAAAFNVALLVRLIALEYRVEEVVGLLPSVV
jgi:hypothetical protein